MVHLNLLNLKNDLYRIFLKVLSYLYPIRIKTFQSEFSGKLELTYYDGALVLDTQKTNYSYGNLQRLLAAGLKQIPEREINRFTEILILGVAGGSVIETLYKNHFYTGNIDAVDIDPVVLQIAEDYFNINQFTKCKLWVADAAQFVAQSTKLYDLVLVDLFLDEVIPDFVFTEPFLNQLKKLIATQGYVLFNTIKTKNKDAGINGMLHAVFGTDYNILVLSHLNPFNTLYLIQKNT
ncbi:fused MFS/spermidine synthase [Flavobacterium agricola]|uniref:Fused MFS/spermidine synthase n=1 Tax=Flavobacterium agricola TaxID=2870839 RepID=A0ABY6M124_9FLAO|nr:fused MFS/spermidine synthase [Flavobacterium agricola]UYW02204.1 fused MFS/spermidine synthase [Flavobacterium agricola]